MARSRLIDLVGVRRTGENTYESCQPPQTMGNNNGTAYGGCAMANLIHAAYQSLPSNRSTFHLYSVLGHFLGPALCDRKIFAYVFPHRNTRTFFTCRVELRQVLDSGEERGIVTALLDFMNAEPALLVYSQPPLRQYSNVEDVADTFDQREKAKADGTLPPKMVDAANVVFGLGLRYFEQRACPEGIGSQNILGMAKHKATSQDHLFITEKTSADYWRVRDKETCVNPPEQFAAMGFVMDAALSFIPLTHNHQFLDEAGACSSLDFALRFFKRGGELDLREWHLREMQTSNGAEGRTYAEGRIWDLQGNMVASMTQQSIMRAPKGAKTLKL